MKSTVPRYLKKVLSKKHVCFVLITCEAPSEDGNMQVEMTYEGDACLAANLLIGAQDFIDDEGFCSEVKEFEREKIHYLK
jgi:hypothetical protein